MTEQPTEMARKIAAHKPCPYPTVEGGIYVGRCSMHVEVVGGHCESCDEREPCLVSRLAAEAEELRETIRRKNDERLRQKCHEPGCGETAQPFCPRHRGDWNEGLALRVERDTAAELARALAEALREMERAMETALIGGNHLASYRRKAWPDRDAGAGYALEVLGPGMEYDVWCCWAALMRARDIARAALAACEPEGAKEKPPTWAYCAHGALLGARCITCEGEPEGEE